MNTGAARVGGIVLVSMMLGGCAVGYNSVVFVTKSNIGLDIDTRPPTAEISIARREGVLAPTFEEGQTPPMLASFRFENSGLTSMFEDITSTFAGGDAAVTMASLYDGPYPGNYPFESALCLNAIPTPTVFGWAVTFPQPGDVRPFLFGTDTSVGLKVAWSGLTAYVPDTVRFGYHRKELAWAPAFARKETCGNGGQYHVKVASFLATVDHDLKLQDPSKSGLKHLQYFATGLAASKLALRPEVRLAMLERQDPVAFEKLEKFEGFRKHFWLQREAVRRIQDAYEKMKNSPEKRTEIRQEAIAPLHLVPEDTSDEGFGKALSRAIDGNNPTVTDRLDALERFIAQNH